MKIGVVIYTYNRVDDARINMEIIRKVWQASGKFEKVVIAHAFNGEKKWWPKNYLEDELLYLKNPGHFGGAELLINEGVKRLQKKHPDLDYTIILAADTWLVKPDYVAKLVKTMHAGEYYVAGATWGRKDSDLFKFGLSLDFNIFDHQWAMKSKLFPLRYQEFTKRYEELLSYQDTAAFLERVFVLRFKQAIVRTTKIPSENLITQVAREHIYQMKEREPVHSPTWGRKMYWPNMGLITHHDPAPKQKALKAWRLKLGAYGTKFLAAKDVSYFNNGLNKTLYIKGKKKLSYEAK